jgi:uncharacterized membrane protein YkoI
MWLIAAFVLGVAARPAAAQDRPVLAPAIQPAADSGGPGDLERAREAARAAAVDPKDERDGKDDDLQRAREAARAADPRLLGIERSRESARDPDHSGGGKDCMSAREARGAITAKRAVTLVQAVRTARSAWDGEVIDYRLCTFDGALAYDLTLLNTEGKVARVRVDADGRLLGVR